MGKNSGGAKRRKDDPKSLSKSLLRQSSRIASQHQDLYQSPSKNKRPKAKAKAAPIMTATEEPLVARRLDALLQRFDEALEKANDHDALSLAIDALSQINAPHAGWTAALADVVSIAREIRPTNSQLKLLGKSRDWRQVPWVRLAVIALFLRGGRLVNAEKSLEGDDWSAEEEASVKTLRSPHAVTGGEEAFDQKVLMALIDGEAREINFDEFSESLLKIDLRRMGLESADQSELWQAVLASLPTLNTAQRLVTLAWLASQLEGGDKLRAATLEAYREELANIHHFEAQALIDLLDSVLQAVDGSQVILEERVGVELAEKTEQLINEASAIIGDELTIKELNEDGEHRLALAAAVAHGHSGLAHNILHDLGNEGPLTAQDRDLLRALHESGHHHGQGDEHAEELSEATKVALEAHQHFERHRSHKSMSDLLDGFKVLTRALLIDPNDSTVSALCNMNSDAGHELTAKPVLEWISALESVIDRAPWAAGVRAVIADSRDRDRKAAQGWVKKGLAVVKTSRDGRVLIQAALSCNLTSEARALVDTLDCDDEGRLELSESYVIARTAHDVTFDPAADELYAKVLEKRGPKLHVLLARSFRNRPADAGVEAAVAELRKALDVNPKDIEAGYETILTAIRGGSPERFEELSAPVLQTQPYLSGFASNLYHLNFTRMEKEERRKLTQTIERELSFYRRFADSMRNNPALAQVNQAAPAEGSESESEGRSEASSEEKTGD